MHNAFRHGNYDLKYYDKRVPEEDTPIDVPIENQIIYEKIDSFFERIFDENSLNVAKQSSKEERDKKGLNESSFVYGEITFRSLSYIFEYIKDKFGEDSIIKGNFIDLGSGIGRGVIAASMIHPFKSYIGIEYLENLHNIALNIKEKFDENFKIFREENEEIIPNFIYNQSIELINGDFLAYDWKDASFIFANSTCFSPELMVSLSKKADELPAGAIFITFTKRLPSLSNNWEINSGFRRLMSWGIATIYIHRKIY